MELAVWFRKDPDWFWTLDHDEQVRLMGFYRAKTTPEPKGAANGR